jgi:glycopeptide antibiotics resistance protein
MIELRMKIFKNVLKYTPKLVFIAYMLVLIYVTLFSQYFGRVWIHRGINLIPFVTIYRYIVSSNNAGLALMNLAGNVIAFMPFGYLLPMVRKGITRFLSILCCIFSASLLIEILQYVLGVGVSDIDDVILNAVGGILGYCLYKLSKTVIAKG